MELLDDPTLLVILSFLNYEDILKRASVLSKRFCLLTRERSIWERLLHSEFGMRADKEKSRGQIMWLLKMANLYRKRGTVMLEKFAGSDDSNGPLKFIKAVASKRGGLILCAETISECLPMITMAICYILLYYPGTSIYYSYEGTNPELFQKVVQLINENTEEDIARRKLADALIYGYEYKRNVANGSAFFYGSCPSLYSRGRRIYPSDGIFINFVSSDAVLHGSATRASVSHMLDDRMWPQENTVHVIIASKFLGGIANVLCGDEFTSFYQRGTEKVPVASLVRVNSTSECTLVYTKDFLKSVLDGWKEFTGIHPDGDSACYVCNDIKKQEMERRQ